MTMNSAVLLVIIFRLAQKNLQRQVGVQFVSQRSGFLIMVTAVVELAKQRFNPFCSYSGLERVVCPHFISE